MFKSSMLVVFFGSLLFFAQAIIAAPFENPSDISDDLLHYALHAVFPHFKDGVFTSNKQAMEFLERENKPLASSVLALAKRQASNSTTTTNTSISSTITTSSTSSSISSVPTTSSTQSTSTTPTTSTTPSPTPPPTTTQPTVTPTEPTTPYVTTSTSSMETVITTNGQRSTSTAVTVVVETVTPSHVQNVPNSAVSTSTFTPELQSSAVKPTSSLSTIMCLLAVNVCLGLLGMMYL